MKRKQLPAGSPRKPPSAANHQRCQRSTPTGGPPEGASWTDVQKMKRKSETNDKIQATQGHPELFLDLLFVGDIFGFLVEAIKHFKNKTKQQQDQELLRGGFVLCVPHKEGRQDGR